MKKHRLSLSTVMTLLFLGALTPQFAQDAGYDAEIPDVVRRACAIGFLRMINTAEAGELSMFGSYSSWQTLLVHNWEQFNDWLSTRYANAREIGLQFGDMPEVLPGWRLRLSVHADGKGYDLMVQDLMSKKCAFAAFSNENGFIWHGKAINCGIEQTGATTPNTTPP